MFVAGRSVEGCGHCEKVARAARGELCTLLWDRPHSVAVIGDHQFYQGYAMILSKHHIREMHDLPADISAALFQDVLELGRTIHSGFQPWKINYASLGNVDEHLHWHVIPRYANDPDKKEHPWKHAELFSQYKTTPEDIRRLKDVLKS